jgi:hypothetical protein
VTQYDTRFTDVTGTRSRRLTSAFVAPGRQYNFTNAKATPDAAWVQIMSSWLEGQRTDMFWAKLPPFPGATANPNILLGSTNLNLSFGAGATGDTLRVSFGYVENGAAPNLFYCTTRKDVCHTSSTATLINPFLFASEAQSPTPCASGCTIPIPAIAGRMMYYHTVRQSAISNSVTGPLSVVAVQ